MKQRCTLGKFTHLETDTWLDYGEWLGLDTDEGKYFVEYSDHEGGVAHQRFDTAAAAIEVYTKLAGWILLGAYSSKDRIKYLKTGTMD